MTATFDALAGHLAALPEPTPEELAERGKILAEEQQREQNKRLWATWDRLTGPMGARYRDCTLENFVMDERIANQKKVVEQLQRYAANIRERISGGQGLLLFGPSGTGKDHLLTGLGRVAVKHELTIRWINGSTLYRSMREGMCENEEELITRYVYPRILYISDPIPPIGMLTPFQGSTLFAIIDGRYREKKATWASMNVGDGQEAAQRLGAAIADRLRDGAISLNCSWPSFRKGIV